MLYYKDFETNRLRWTHGTPTAVIRDGLRIERLVIEKKASTLFIPRYLLHGASINWFYELKRRQEEAL